MITPGDLFGSYLGLSPSAIWLVLPWMVTYLSTLKICTHVLTCTHSSTLAILNLQIITKVTAVNLCLELIVVNHTDLGMYFFTSANLRTHTLMDKQVRVTLIGVYSTMHHTPIIVM